MLLIKRSDLPVGQIVAFTMLFISQGRASYIFLTTGE